MAIYTTTDFKRTLQTDMWVMEQLLRLPANKPTEEIQVYDQATGITDIHVKLYADICLGAKQKAISDYRANLTPIFFTLAQKVYAELFRLFLGQNHISAKNRQADVEDEINKQVLRNNSIVSVTFTPVFQDRADFDDWYMRKYTYKDLREARNQIIDHEYTLANDTLLVNNRHGNQVLNWNTHTVQTFVQSVLGNARTI